MGLIADASWRPLVRYAYCLAFTGRHQRSSMSVPMMALCPLVAQSEVRTAHEIDPGGPRFNCDGYL
jgi:hypothetical protein